MFKNLLAAIVITDVMYHLPEARGFLAEAKQCVRSGGLVIMLEPWVTSWSRLVDSKLHHEPVCF